MLSRTLRERYRCPDSFLEFALVGELSSDPGFFEFGPGATCYGRSCVGIRQGEAEDSLDDMLRDSVSNHGKLALPFDPDEVIDNLRLERYPHGCESGYNNLLKKLYYLLRPLTTISTRKQVQKFHARNWRTLRFPHWPVDTTVEDICERLLLLSMQSQGVDRVPFIWFWPRGAGGCATMTHDVEGVTGRDFCRALMDIDDSFGIKAAFQIVPESRYAVSATFLDEIRRRGFEIGVHDLNHDGGLFDNRRRFLRRVGHINRYGKEYGAKGFRAGALYRRSEWYCDLEFSFDMSIPNVAHMEAQRGGCCTVMPYFIGKILEVPVTTTQDYAMFHLLDERSIDLWKTQIHRILEKNGLASFLIHPDYVRDRDAMATYRALLSYLCRLRDETSIWFALPREIDSWWRARSRMSVVAKGSSWRIEGDGAEQAVLAFAKEVNGRLVYELAEPERKLPDGAWNGS